MQKILLAGFFLGLFWTTPSLAQITDHPCNNQGNIGVLDQCRTQEQKAAEERRNKCEAAQKDATTALNNMNKACGAAGIGGGKRCTEVVATCNACMSGDDAVCPNSDMYESYLEALESAKDEGQLIPTPKYDVKELAACPHVARENLDDIEEYADRKKKEKEDLEDRLNTLNEELQKKEAEYEDNENLNVSEREKLEKFREEAMEELVAATKEMTEEKQKQYDEMGNQITQLTQQLKMLAMQKEENIKTEELACYNKAITDLKADIAKRESKTAQSQFSVGSFSAAVRGKNTQASGKNIIKSRNKTFAEQAYLDCVGGGDHRIKVDTIMKRYQLAVQAVNDQINKINADMGKLILEIGGEKMRKEYERKIKQINNEYNERMKEHVRAYSMNQKTLAAQIQKLRNEINSLKVRLREADLQLQGYQKAYHVASIHGKRSAKKGGGDLDIESAQFDAYDKTLHAFNMCHCEPGSTMQEQQCSTITTNARNLGIPEASVGGASVQRINAPRPTGNNPSTQQGK